MKRIIKSWILSIIVVIFISSHVFAALNIVSEGELSGAMKQSAADGLFKISGDNKSYTLADASNGYFIIANDSYGTRKFSDNSQKFDITDTENIAYWLNNEFLAEDYDGERLHESIINNLVIHTWQTEPGTGKDECAVEYETQCKVALISITELKTYIEKIGIRDNLNRFGSSADCYNYWWTRSPSGINSSKIMAIGSDNNYMLGFNSGTELTVRPVFYVNENFFKTTKLDVHYMGRDIKGILKTFTDEELEYIGYLQDEIELIKNNCNTVMSVSIAPEWTSNTEEINDRHFIIDDKIRFNIICNNTADTEISIYYGWAVNGNISAILKETIPAKEEKEIKVNLPITVDGKYKIEVLTSSDGMNFSRELYMVSYINSVSGTNKTKGYATHFAHGNPIDETIQLLKASGVKIVRDGGYWKNIEWNGNGNYNWTTVDSYIKALNENDIDLIYVLGLGNDNYYTYDENGNRTPFISENEIQGFVNYATAFAKKYPYVTKYELWNEPNLTHTWGSNLDVNVYKNLVRRVSEALKAVNPDIEIIVGVTSGANDASVLWTDFLEALLDDDTASYIDGISFHHYFNFHRRADNYPSKEETVFAIIKKLMDKKGGFLKLYLTETGAFTGVNSWEKTQEEKNEELVRIFAEADAHGIDYTMVYDFVKDGNVESYSEHNYGVITSPSAGFEPTSAYYSVKNYMDICGSGIYMGKLMLDENITSHIYLVEGEPVAIMWGNQPYDDDSEYCLELENEITAYNIFNEEIANGKFVDVGHSPIFVYGLSRKWILNATFEMAKGELKGLGEDLGISVDEIILDIDGITCADDVYSMMEEIYDLSNEFGNLQDNIAEKTYIARLNAAADYVAKSLVYYDDAEEITYAHIQKAYSNYEKTLNKIKSHNYKGAEEIYDFGKEIIKEAESYVREQGCIEVIDELFMLNEKGVLTVFGKTSYGGETVNIKITDSEDKPVYIGAVTSDTEGNYRLTMNSLWEYGTYKLFVKGEKEELKTTIIDYFENTGYQSCNLKILYGRIIESENLLDLSRKHLFKYAVIDGDILVDIAWDAVNEYEAKAMCTVKNNSDISGISIILAGYTNNRLVDLSINPLTFEKTEYEFVLNYENKPEKFKAFAWNSNLQIMVPVSAVYSY